MKGTLLYITFSPETEAKRVIQTLNKRGWYRDHGYLATLYLPKAVDINEEQIHKETIQKAVEAEYEEKAYADVKEEMICVWNEVGEKVMRTFHENSLATQDVYEVQLTRYGTGGSYFSPNKIIINIAKTKVSLATLVHEMLHLSIEHYILQYGISQTQKERIVELLTKRLFPELSLGKETKNCADVEKSFEEHFPNIERILSQVAKVAKK